MIHKKGYSPNNIANKGNSGKSRAVYEALSSDPLGVIKPKLSDSGFRLSAKKIALTIPKIQPRMTPTWILKRLVKILQSAEKKLFEEYCVAVEKHKDGSNHSHIYMEFKTKFDTKNPSFFDIYSHNKTFHGKLEGVKNKERYLNYITKDDNYVANIDVRPVWKQIIEDSNTDQDFHESILYDQRGYKSYSGYRSLLELWKIKKNKGISGVSPDPRKFMKKNVDDTQDIKKMMAK